MWWVGIRMNSLHQHCGRSGGEFERKCFQAILQWWDLVRIQEWQASCSDCHLHLYKWKQDVPDLLDFYEYLERLSQFKTTINKHDQLKCHHTHVRLADQGLQMYRGKFRERVQTRVYLSIHTELSLANWYERPDTSEFQESWDNKGQRVKKYQGRFRTRKARD